MPKANLVNGHVFTKKSLAYVIACSDLSEEAKNKLQAELSHEPEDSVFNLEFKPDGGALIFIETPQKEKK